MANSSNPLSSVSVVKWKMSRNGLPVVTHCNCRSFRSDDNLNERYDAVVTSLKEQGYSLAPLEVPEWEDYIGVRGRRVSKSLERYSTEYVVVFIDRNPVWDPR